MSTYEPERVPMSVCKPLRLQLAHEEHDEPTGHPRAAIEIEGVEYKNNCWVSAAVAVLANDPLIALFANDICWFNAAHERVERRAYGQKSKEELDVEDVALAHLVLSSIYLINNAHFLGEVGRTRHRDVATQLYTWMNKRADDPVGMDDASHHLLGLHIVIQKAMRAWGAHPELWELFRDYGCAPKTAIVAVCHVCDERSTTLLPPPSHDIVQDVAMYQVSWQNKPTASPVWLEHALVDSHFNSSVTDAKNNEFNDTYRNHDMDKHLGSVVNGTRSISYRGLCTLPFRFYVDVRRTTKDGVTKANRPDPVIYNPTNLVIGPTITTNEWGRYRLVARLVHGSAHWVSDVLPLDQPGRFTPPPKGAGWPSLVRLSWDKPTPLRAPPSYNASTQHIRDTECSMLVFERYQ